MIRTYAKCEQCQSERGHVVVVNGRQRFECECGHMTDGGPVQNPKFYELTRGQRDRNEGNLRRTGD